MKKKSCTILLAIALVLSLMTSVFAETIDISTLDKDISTLETEVASLNNEISILGKDVNVIMGNVFSTNPYIISGSGAGDQCTNALLSGIKYFVVKDPQDGQLTAGYFYNGTHKYVGTTTIVIGKQEYTAYVFDKFIDLEKWRTLGKLVKEKEARLAELKSQKKSLENSIELQSLSEMIDENLIENNDGTYTLNDAVMGCKFTYPKKFGKPKVNTDYKYSLKMEYGKSVMTTITITYEGGGIEYLRYKAYNRGDEIPLSDENSGIEMIKLYKSYSGEGITIYGNNKMVITIDWSTNLVYLRGEGKDPDVDSERAEMREVIREIVKSFTMDESVG